MSKGLTVSVAIMGGGRWARALGGRLAHNPDRVARVVQLVRSTDEHRSRHQQDGTGTGADGAQRSGSHSIDSAQRSAGPAIDSAQRGAGPAIDTARRSAPPSLDSAQRSAPSSISEPSSIELSEDMSVLGQVDMVILAVSAGAARALLREAGAVLHGGQFLVHAIGSLEPGAQAATRMSDVIQQETPVRRIGALAGPALAQDLEEGRPAALICGSRFDEVGQAVSAALSSSSLRVYTTRDLFGVELARAMVAEVAVAAGVARALEMGPAARAILIARGAAEMARLGTALGASERTFFGLAGVGELVVATEGRGSADFELGVMLGRGLPLPEALKRIGRRCDGPTMVAEAYRLGQQHGVRMTLTTALHRWLGGERSMQQGLRDLFAGDDRGE